MFLTTKELMSFMATQKKIFDIVRVVDASMKKQYQLSDQGELMELPYECYAVWKKKERCENCVSLKAIATKGQVTKFEFKGDEIYFVIARYVVIDETPYTIEMVTKSTDNTLYGAFGNGQFIQSIEKYNKKLYFDALTGAYNRYYYEEQIKGMENCSAVVMLDLDNFKMINDTYGHVIGDHVLKELTQAIKTNMSSLDVVIRWGGDEFLIIFKEIDYKGLKKKLENIQQDVKKIKCEEYPELKVSYSAGGVLSEASPDDLVVKADQHLNKAKETKDAFVIV